MLDEATAAAEAMTFCKRLSKNRTSQAFFASRHCHPQTLDVLRTRAEPLGIEVVVGDESAIEDFSAYFGALLQYPTCDGEIDPQRWIAHAGCGERLGRASVSLALMR